MSRPINLLTLLRLLDGRVSPSEGTALRELIVTDADVRSHWQSLWQVSQGAAESAGAAESPWPTTGQPGEVSAELVAALVEGALEPEAAAAVERECWRSPVLLAEALSTFRFLHGPVERPDVPRELTARLLQIGSQVETPPAPVSGEFVMTLAEVAATRPLLDHGRNRSARGTRFAFAAALLFVAGIVIMLWLRNGRDRAQPDAGGGNIARQPKVEAVNDDREPRSRDETPPAPREKPEPLVVQNPPPTTDKKPDEPTVPKPAPDPKPAPPPNVPNEPRSVAQLAWSDIRGLVVSAAGDDSVWKSAADSIRLDSPARLATLPDSWALGKLSRGGELVLAADTEIVLSVGAGSPPALDLALSRGRFALRDLAVDTALRIQIGSIQFDIAAGDRNTSLGVEWHASTPRFVVRTGQVKLGDKVIKSGRQVIWAETGFGLPQTTKGNVAWMQRPEATTRLPANLLASLQASDDVFATLDDLRSDSKSASDARLIASRWSFALKPGDSVWESLNSPVEAVRVQTIEAIVRMLDHDPRMPQVVRTLTAAINDQQTLADIHRWFQLAARGERLRPADAWTMVDSLDHTELAVRQMAVLFLERGTGTRLPAYNPADAPRARMQGILQWTRLVNQRFGPRQAPRRRVP